MKSIKRFVNDEKQKAQYIKMFKENSLEAEAMSKFIKRNNDLLLKVFSNK